MLKMLVLLALTALFSSTWASLNLHGAPLFSGETSFTFEVETATETRSTTCYITSGVVNQCRRKRGMEEKPQIIQNYDDIVPSAVLGIQPTAVPRATKRFYPAGLFSSFDDSYFNTQNVFRQIASKGRSNKITVGDCGKSTVNLSQFLSCLGMTVQETTTLTATFTEIATASSGYAVMTVMGCTPAGFPYLACTAIPEYVDSSADDVPMAVVSNPDPIEPSSPTSTWPTTATTVENIVVATEIP